MDYLAIHRALAARGQDSRLALIQPRAHFQKVEKSKFLGDPPDDHPGLLECHMAMPGNAAVEDFIDENDSTTLKKIAEIKTRFNVWIKINSSGNFVTVFSEGQEGLEAATNELRAFLIVLNQEVQGKMIALADHSISSSRVPVEIKLVGADNAFFRPVTQVPPGEDLIDLTDYAHENRENHSQHLFDGEGPKDSPEPEAMASDGALDDLAHQFKAAVCEAGKRIRPVEGELRVRVNMGVFTIKKRQAKKDTYNSDKTLRDFLNNSANRGYIFVGHRLGNEHYAGRMLDILYQTEDLDNLDTTEFMPADPTIISIRDIKPKFCLVLFSKDLIFEVDVLYKPDYNENPRVATVRAYSVARRDKVFEIATACPNRKFDWHLCIEATSAANRIPAEIQAFLERGLKFKCPVSRKNHFNDDFPMTNMNNHLLRAASIDKVACKVSWTFQSARKPYCLEVSVYHEWGAEFLLTEPKPMSPWKVLNTAGVPTPIKSCGVAFWGNNWDSKMRAINRPGGGLQADFAKGLPGLFDTGDPGSGIDDFLGEMKRLHYFTERATVTGGQ